jgi:hypothetical protein
MSAETRKSQALPGYTENIFLRMLMMTYQYALEEDENEDGGRGEGETINHTIF